MEKPSHKDKSMSVFRDIECSKCKGVFESFQAMDCPKLYTAECPLCNATCNLERVYITAPGISFGGISGAVNGSGFYTTDYKNSDLVKRRAIEHRSRIRGE